MIIVTGHLLVDPSDRDAYLKTCAEVVRQARDAPGCLDFAISADLLDESRISVLERWESREHVEAFRGSGPSDEQHSVLRGGYVAEYDVGDVRPLLG